MPGDPNSRKNPYDHRCPASEEVFVGRNTTVARLVNGIRAGHSYELIGQVGVGKTSILLAVKKRLIHGPIRSLESVPVPIYMSVNEQNLVRVENILAAILTGFLDALKEQCQLLFPPAERDALFIDVYHRKIEEALRTIFTWYYSQKQRSCRLVILLDDLQRGSGYEALSQAFSILRPLLSSTDRSIKISLVLSGRLPMVEIMRKDVSTLKGLLSGSVSLAPLGPNDVASLIDLAEDYGWKVEPHSEQAIFEMTEGHPFKLHYYLFTAIDRYGLINSSALEKIHADSVVQNYLKIVLGQKAPAPSRMKMLHLFYAYAHADKDWLEGLWKQLSSLRKNKEIQDWHAGKIELGEDINAEVSKQLAKADIVLLLISPDFVSSEGLEQTQVRLAMAKHEAGISTVIPVLLRRIDWKGELYGELQAVPRNGQWIAEQGNPEKALAEAAEEIKVVITKLRSS